MSDYLVFDSDSKKKKSEKTPAPTVPLGPVDKKEHESDRGVERALRPEKLSEFVGQPDLVKSLELSIKASKKRSEPLDHCLFSGPPGLGKTSLAHLVSKEMGTRLLLVSGPSIDRKGDLASLLTQLDTGDVLFIDEIHRLNISLEETLYTAMEDYALDIVIGQGPGAKTVRLDLKPFTLVGATTRSGLLSNPLRDRFGLSFHLELYRPEDLVFILKASAARLGLSGEDEAFENLSRRCRGTPRIANRLLRVLPPCTTS